MAYSPFALCIVIVIVALLLAIGVATAYERAGYGYVDRAHLWKTCYSSVHYGWLLGFRIIAFLYCLGVMVYDIVIWGPFVYEYYTQWTFTLLILYFGVAIGATIKEIHRNRNASSSETSGVPSNQSALLSGNPEVDEEVGADVVVLDSSAGTYSQTAAGCGGYFLQICYQVEFCAAFSTDIIYWAFIFPSNPFVDIIEISMHAVNLGLLLIDFSLNSMTFPWYRGAYFIIWTAAYVIATWIFHACGENVWPYSFLDVSEDLAPLWYFLLCIVLIFAYALVCWLAHFKLVCLRHFQASQA